jgi:hypothetical protein
MRPVKTAEQQAISTVHRTGDPLGNSGFPRMWHLDPGALMALALRSV